MSTIIQYWTSRYFALCIGVLCWYVHQQYAVVSREAWVHSACAL